MLCLRTTLLLAVELLDLSLRANRLTEDPYISVMVLETGTDHLQDPRVNIPAFWAALLGTEVDWQFTTVPQV